MKQGIVHGILVAALSLASVGAVTSFTSPALAALTPSEQAQIRDFYRAGAKNQADRIRSLVARPDLSAAESADALRDAVASVPFTPERAAVLREVAFAPSAEASRQVLLPAITRAMLARADAVLGRLANVDDPRATDELTLLYTFLVREVAEQPDAKVTRAAREECGKAALEHIEKNGRHLRMDGGPTALASMRAQANALFFEMLPEGPTKRLDAADKLGLRGARRQMLLEWGLVAADGKNADDARFAALRSVLERTPGLRTDVTLIVLGDKSSRAVSRGRTLALAGDLLTASPSFWGDEVDTGDLSPTAFVIGELARPASARALQNRGELRTLAEHDVSQSDKDRPLGKPADATLEAQVGAAVQLLLVDASRAFDWALVRFLSAKPESAAILSDALGVLVALSPPPTGQELTLPLGKPGSGPIPDLALATGVRLLPNGAVSALTFGGHAWTFERDEATGAVRAIRRDGQPVNVGMLSSARMAMTETSTWTYGGVAFAKLLGSPRAGMGPGPHVRLDAQSQMDVIATPAPGNDFVIECELNVEGGEGGIGFRARTLRDTRQKLPKDYLFGGIVTLVPDVDNPRVALVTAEELSHQAYMAAPAYGPFAGPMHVRIQVKGTKVTARVGNVTFNGTLPHTMDTGSIVLFGRRGAKVEVLSFSVKKL
jgi:hypothetical protein